MTYCRVYQAEDRAFARRYRRYRHEPHGLDLDVARAIVDRWTDGVVVRRGRGRDFNSRASWRWGPYDDDGNRPMLNPTITLGPNAGLAVVCHEVAHILARTGRHDQRFALIYVELVAAEIGRHVADCLLRRFVDVGLLPKAAVA